MKKTLLLVVLTGIFSSYSIAQDWSGEKYKYYDIYPGYIISAEGDTTNGYVEHGNRSSMQKQITFFSDASKKDRKKFKPSELKGYGVADKHYRTIAFGGGSFGKPLSFGLVAKDGRVSQITFYTMKENAGIMGKQETAAQYDERIHTDEIIWQKLDEKPLQHQTLILGFAKKISNLLSDYPELSSKVETKEKGYGLINIFKIIDEYNSWWAAK